MWIYTLGCNFFLAATLVAVVMSECPEPPPVTNAYRTLTSNMTDSSVQYECYSGFRLTQGNLTRRCQSNGSYSGLPPVCILDCGIPRSVVGAVNSYTSTTWNSVANYTCWSNYTKENYTDDYTTSCHHYSRGWRNKAFECSEPEPFDVFGQDTFTSDGIPDDRPIDGNVTSCYTSSPQTEVHWGVYIKYKTLVDIHRLRIYLGSSATSITSLTINSMYDPSNPVNCPTTTPTLVANQWLEITTNIDNKAKCVGYILKITATFSTPTSLELCEVEVFGRIREVDCEQPLFYYGAVPKFNSTVLTSYTRYECRPGFVRTAGYNSSICWASGWWSYNRMKCYDGYQVGIKSSWLESEIVDKNISTCHHNINGSYVNVTILERVEIHSVTVLGPTSWSGITVGVSLLSTLIDRKPCEADGQDKHDADVRTFYCRHRPVAVVGNIVSLYLPQPTSICEVTVWGRAMANEAEVFECLQTTKGEEYKGSLNRTMDGETCQPWPATVDLTGFPDFFLDGLNNYCRNPGGVGQAPWCYTSSDYKNWSYCPLVPCERMCKTESDGSNYKGFKNRPSESEQCIPWYYPIANMEPFTQEIVTSQNNCRNFGRSQSSPYCHTGLTSIEDYRLCNIPDCPFELRFLELMTEDGFITGEFEDCWSIMKDTEEMSYVDLPRFNIDTGMESECTNNSFVNLNCYNNTGDQLWYIIHFDCSLLFTSVTTEGQTTEYVITTQDDVTSTQNATPSPGNTTSAPEMATNTTETSSTDLTTASIVKKEFNMEPNTTLAPSVTDDLCNCQCDWHEHLNYTDDEIRISINTIYEMLLLDRKLLNSDRRRYVSLEDDRPSATYVGSSAVGLFLTPVIFILLLDLNKLVDYLWRFRNNRSWRNIGD